MTESFFETVRYGLAVALLAALLPGGSGGEGEPRVGLRVWIAGVGAGGGLALLYGLSDARTLVEAIAMLAACPFLAALLVPAASGHQRRRAVAVGGAALLLTAQRTAALASFVRDRSLDRVQVLNSDFLVFFGGIALAIVLLAAGGGTLRRLAPSQRGARRRAALTAALLLLLGEHLAWGTYALFLSGWLGLPEILFGPLTTVINHIRLFGYGQMFVLAVFGVGAILGRQRAAEVSLEGMGAARRRKYLWSLRRQKRLGTAFVFAAIATAGVCFYYTLYASRPPRLSAAERVEAQAGRLLISVQELASGELHRYAFTGEEGRVLRFIALQDQTGRVRAAYDACTFCGSTGYIKKGDDLVCLACGAAIYAPTLGREGGCNPIPLAYSIEDGNLVVTVRDLLEGDGAAEFGGDPGASP